MVFPGEFHEVDAGHGVVHHKVQRPLNAAVHVGPGRQVEDNLKALLDIVLLLNHIAVKK